MNQPALLILNEKLTVCRLAPTRPIPGWANGGTFLTITRTADELSIVCETQYVPEDIQREPGWRAFKVLGPLDFALIGILAGISGALAQAGISLFAISTYDTDYILVREEQLAQAAQALRQAGYPITNGIQDRPD